MVKCQNPNCKCENCQCGEECSCGTKQNCCHEEKKCCCQQEHECNQHQEVKHPSHMENMPRLNRISGQVDGVKKMIEEGRYCPEILIQLKAIRSAIRAVESNILTKHLQHCVALSFSADDHENKIAELKTLFDRFEE